MHDVDPPSPSSANRSTGKEPFSVVGEQVQTLYARYREGQYVVNRRYQRKLVWTLDEKVAFIDSVIRRMPVPLVLFAESESERVEIIDGLQRLNALFSFIENEFRITGGYFNLEAIADTKALLDEGVVEQRHPMIDRDTSRLVTNYILPQSIYRSPSREAVDEVFRRINSGGRQLTEQEIRQAGDLSTTAEVVRRLAAHIRQDSSLGDILPLDSMGLISITSRDLPYGINVDTILWVKHGILTREQVRGSRDEEVVLDLLADLLLNPMAPTGKDYRDSYYGWRRADSDDDEIPIDALEAALAIAGKDRVIDTFRRALDAFVATLEESDRTFAQLILEKPPRGVQRYFHAIFFQFLQAAGDGKHVIDYTAMASTLDGIGSRMSISTGGTWSVANKRAVFDRVAGMVGQHFASGESGRVEHSAARFESLLAAAVTEQSAFEIKQGFLRLDGTRAFNEDALARAIRSATAIANRGPKDPGGYLIFGVADTASDADRVRHVWAVEAVPYRGFSVTGTGHELLHLGRTYDQFYSELAARIQSLPVPKTFAEELVRHLRPVHYRRNRLVWVFEIQGAPSAVPYDGAFYDRVGPHTRQVEANEMQHFMSRFFSAQS